MTTDTPIVEWILHRLVYEFGEDHYGEFPRALIMPAQMYVEYVKTSQQIKYQSLEPDGSFRPKFMGIPLYGVPEENGILALGKDVDLSEWGIEEKKAGG